MSTIRFELQREGRGQKEFRTIENALINVVECDLAFGGRATTFEPMKIVTETSVMGVVDHCTYEGSEQDMASLYMAVVVHRHMDELMRRNQPAFTLTDEERESVSIAFRGSEWLYKEIGGPNVLGHIYHSNSRAKKIYMAMLQPQSEKEMLGLCRKSARDLCALVCFKHIEKVSEEDFRALAYA